MPFERWVSYDEGFLKENPWIVEIKGESAYFCEHCCEKHDYISLCSVCGEPDVYVWKELNSKSRHHNDRWTGLLPISHEFVADQKYAWRFCSDKEPVCKICCEPNIFFWERSWRAEDFRTHDCRHYYNDFDCDKWIPTEKKHLFQASKYHDHLFQASKYHDPLKVKASREKREKQAERRKSPNQRKAKRASPYYRG